MSRFRFGSFRILIFICSLGLGELPAQQQGKPDDLPVLRLEADGPRSYVSGLAFSPDGRWLYATGLDKAVLTWKRESNNQPFQYSSANTLRTPVGAGADGYLNALAVSDDGRWLATAGIGLIRGAADLKSSGWLIPVSQFPPDKARDRGVIYVFDIANHTATALRGHTGDVQTLGFVHGSKSSPPELVSVAEDHYDQNDRPKKQYRLRFWDVQNKKKEITELSSVPLPDLRYRPGIYAWSTGNSANQARVAIVWGDDQFRVWDVDSNAVTNSPGSSFSTVVPLDSMGKEFLVGSYARIALCSVRDAANGRLGRLTDESFRQTAIPTVNNVPGNYPVAGVLVPSRACVAFIIRKDVRGRQEYRLLITTAKHPIQSINEIALTWDYEIRQPSMAASRDGSTLAIAGNKNREIEVFSVDDLLRSNVAKDSQGLTRLQPKQRVKNPGIAFQSASFVQNEQNGSWGLQLSDSENVNYLFDVVERRVGAMTNQWRLADSSKEGWSVVQGEKSTVEIRSAANPLGTKLKLAEGFNLSTDPMTKAIDKSQIAWSPATADRNYPLIAISSENATRERSLMLFNGATGTTLRACTSHTSKIRSVNFSRDGRMLVSASDDRTVCVWTTTDLPERLGKHGAILGIGFRSETGPAVVNAAPETHPLQRGDVIQKATFGNEQPSEITSRKDYYLFVRGRKPGETVEFSILRNGQSQTVPCQIEQDIDDARPLFTLFVAPTARDGGFEWVGWNPLGPFDLRGDHVDQWLGWHFNTGDPNKPADFSEIGQYREQFYDRGLLQKLIDLQKLPRVETRPPVDPKVSFHLEDSEGAYVRPIYEDDEVPLLRRLDVRLIAHVEDVPNRRISEFKMKIGTEILPLKLEQVEDGSPRWSVDVSNVPWQRASNLFALSLETNGRTFTQPGRIDFFPNPPKVDWNRDSKWGDKFDQPEIAVNATVNSASEPFDVNLLVYGPDGAQAFVKKWGRIQPPILNINQVVPLAPGENRIEIEAWNSNAPAGMRSSESSSRLEIVNRLIPPTAPAISLTSIESLAEDQPFITLTPDQTSSDTYHSLEPKVRVRGTISGQEVLSRSDLWINGEKQQLKGFVENLFQAFDFNDLLTLKPGRNTVVIRSEIGKEKAEKTIVFYYERSAPKFASLQVSSDVVRPLPPGFSVRENEFYESHHQSTAKVVAKFDSDLADDDQVLLFVDKEPIPADKFKLDRAVTPNRLDAEIQLKGGKNTILARVQKEWSQSTTMKPKLSPDRRSDNREVEVRFLNPPSLKEVEGDRQLTDKALSAKLVVRSESPVRSGKLIIDAEHEITIDSKNTRWGSIEKLSTSPDEYVLSVRDIELPSGEYNLKFLAENNDGSSIIPAEHKVKVDHKITVDSVAPLVEIEPVDHVFQAESKSFQSASRRVQIKYSVTSDAHIDIALTKRGKYDTEPIVLGLQNKSGNRTTGTASVELYDGVNDIVLEATNSFGQKSEDTLKVTYAAFPAQVEIVSIDAKKPRWKDGIGMFEEWNSPTSRVRLEGRVKFKEEELVNQGLKARIRVNSLMQIATVTDFVTEDSGTIGTFKADLILTRPTGNKIVVEVFNADALHPSFVDDYRTLELGCQEPAKNQDLYLLILGTADADQLNKDVKEALQVTDVFDEGAGGESWKSSLFTRVYPYNAINASARIARRSLEIIPRNMKYRSRTSSGIVMIYFQGKIVLKNSDFELITETGQSQDDPLTGRFLENTLKDMPGAHLVLLDLKQNEQKLTERDVWPRAPQLGVMISNWNKNEAQPSKTRLISALQRVLPENRIVRDLASRIEAKYRDDKRDYPDSIEARLDLVRDIHDVRIGID